MNASVDQEMEFKEQKDCVTLHVYTIHPRCPVRTNPNNMNSVLEVPGWARTAVGHHMGYCNCSPQSFA